MSVFYSDAAEWNPDCLFLLLVHHLLDLGTNVAEVASAVNCTIKEVFIFSFQFCGRFK